ncbi:MAG: hypothetical protein HOP12_03280 [Candidatus Eisenbacteria bacterium]|uniref:DUF4019 domain-containing protein n=1 Tax=Eiseniibacteriota bacterium TaxID=2212470 RepID=A0A849SCT5_UNCEI|nr:hypothetical protein [Candidatus Eisenbacteria bacterium]
MRCIRFTALVLSLQCLGVAAVAAAPPSTSGKAVTSAIEDREGWPDTRAAERGRRWVRAFSTGEAAMREFNTRELARESIKAKGVEARVESYRNLRERFGKLVLGSVVESTPYRITVKLLASDATSHEFIFTVEDRTPFKLKSVGMREPGHGGHGLKDWFHH